MQQGIIFSVDFFQGQFVFNSNIETLYDSKEFLLYDAIEAYDEEVGLPDDLDEVEFFEAHEDDIKVTCTGFSGTFFERLKNEFERGYEDEVFNVLSEIKDEPRICDDDFDKLDAYIAIFGIEDFDYNKFDERYIGEYISDAVMAEAFVTETEEIDEKWVLYIDWDRYFWSNFSTEVDSHNDFYFWSY